MQGLYARSLIDFKIARHTRRSMPLEFSSRPEHYWRRRQFATVRFACDLATASGRHRDVAHRENSPTTTPLNAAAAGVTESTSRPLCGLRPVVLLLLLD
jgi:hypothetical protein